MSNGFRTVIKNYREKSDPSGRVTLARIKPKIAGQSRRVLEARAKREEQRWLAAEHYSPIPATETDK